MPTEAFLKQKSDEIENLLEIIATKIQTSNHKFLDISGELQSIKLIFGDIEKELNKSACDGQSERASLLTATTKTIQLFQEGQDDINTFSNDYSDPVYGELNQHIRSYNLIKQDIQNYIQTGKKSETFSGALQPYTYYDALSDSFSFDEQGEETGALDDFLALMHQENNKLTFNLSRRFTPVRTVTDLASYFIGYQSATFFNKLSGEGAHLLPFLPYEWLAVAGGEGLNAFLNGFFFGVFAKMLGHKLKELFVKDSPEMTRLKNLDLSFQAKFLRGFKSAARLSFIGGLSAFSVVPFSAIDWQVYESIYRVAIVSAAYGGLHGSGSVELQKFILKLSQPVPFFYRYCTYDNVGWEKYHVAQTAARVKAAFRRNFESGANRLLKNKIEISEDLLQKVSELVSKKEKGLNDTMQLFSIIHSLALPPAKSYKLNDAMRTLIQLAGELGIILTLIGYAVDADNTIAQLDKKSDRSSLNMGLSGAVTSVFLGLYCRIVWDITANIYEATLGVPIKYICHEWQNTRTWFEFFREITLGSAENISSGVAKYYKRLSETWIQRDSLIDFLSQHGGTMKSFLIGPEGLLGWGSAASVLYLNYMYLDGLSEKLFDDPKLLFKISVWPAIVIATLINVYAVNPVLGALWNKFERIFAYTENKKSEFLLSDFKDFTLELIDKTHEAVIIQILFDMIKRIKNPDVAEKIISGFFVGLTVQNVFGKAFVESSVSKSGSSDISGQQEDFGITIISTASTIKHPFCSAIEKLHGQLEYHRFFQPPPVVQQDQNSLLHHTL